MAKPDAAWTGSSGHLHMSLWDVAGDRSLTNDPEAGLPYGMSKMFSQFVAGMMQLSRELAIFIAPNVNSYKRYASLSWAPVNVVWGRDNRTTGFRLVGHGAALHVEDRFPGGDMNAYLTYAAMIGAGLYGIEHELALEPEFKGNGYVATGIPACRGRSTRRSRSSSGARLRSRSSARTSSTTTSTPLASSSRSTTRSSTLGPRALPRAELDGPSPRGGEGEGSSDSAGGTRRPPAVTSGRDADRQARIGGQASPAREARQTRPRPAQTQTPTRPRPSPGPGRAGDAGRDGYRAVATSRIRLATSAWLAASAVSAGVSPASVTAPGSARADRNSSTSSGSPFCAAAWRAVNPPAWRALTSAPAARRSGRPRDAGRRPRCGAAGRPGRCRLPTFTSAPASSRIRATSGLPKKAAKWRAVNPSAEGPRRLRVLVKTRVQPVDIAERRGLEHVQVGVRLQKRVGHGAIEPVPREHQRRHAVEVARPGQLRLGGDQLGDPGGVAKLDRGDQVRICRHWTIVRVPRARRAGRSGRYSDADANMRGVRCDSTTRSRSSPAAAAGWAAWPPSCSPRRAPASWSPSTTRRPARRPLTWSAPPAASRRFIRADVSKEADARAMVDHAVATYGRLDCLYNNAGVMPEADHSVIGHRRRDLGRGHGRQRARRLPRLQVRDPDDDRRGAGSIVNIASFVAILGCSVPQDAYTASKGAVLSLTRSLAVQFAPKGDPDQRDLPGAGRDAAAHGLAAQGRGRQAAPAGS